MPQATISEDQIARILTPAPVAFIDWGVAVGAGGWGESMGCVAMAALSMTSNPTATETVTIGSDVYEWGGAGSNINVAIGADADECHAHLVAAINTQGTENVVADYKQLIAAGSTRIQAADSPGGTPVIGAGPDLGLSETMGHGNSVWSMDNLNLVGVPKTPKLAGGTLVVNASLSVFFAVRVILPFKVTHVQWEAFATDGTKKATTAIVKPAFPGLGGHLDFNIKNGASPLVATDQIVWTAFGHE
jgi:hypothetical protein